MEPPRAKAAAGEVKSAFGGFRGKRSVLNQISEKFHLFALRKSVKKLEGS